MWILCLPLVINKPLKRSNIINHIWYNESSITTKIEKVLPHERTKIHIDRVLAIPVWGEPNDLIQTLVTWLPHLHVCTLAYLLTSLPARPKGSPTFLWRWSSDRWGHRPTESLEHTNRDNDWLIWVSETGAIDRGTMQCLAAGHCAGLKR